jgi:hypothetical protein
VSGRPPRDDDRPADGEAPTMDEKSFEELAGEPAPGLLREFWLFLAYNKKWWLLPILLVILGFGVLVFLSSTPLAPFIYTMF